MLASCFPTAVAWLIISIVLNATYGHAFGGLSHVCKKVFKLSPSIANTDPASSVSVCVTTVQISRPGDHGLPDAVGSGCLAPDGSSVGLVYGSSKLVNQAPARRCVSGSEAIVENRQGFAAIASTERSCAFLGVERDIRGIRDNDQPSKAFTDEADFSGHGIGDSMLCSAVGDRRQPALTAIVVKTK